MCEEIAVLVKINTWSLFPKSREHNVIFCKWIFRIKHKQNGSIDRYKGRFVAKGFHQRPGIEFTYTFSPVVNTTTICILVTFVVYFNQTLYQLDINNAFIQGTLDEEVYMDQPPRFTNKSYPELVCKLYKAIYGLCQDPHAWYTKFKNFIASIHFVCSQSDPSLFILRGTNSVVLLVYVNDIILTGCSMSKLYHVNDALAHHFSLKDLSL